MPGAVPPRESHSLEFSASVLDRTVHVSTPFPSFNWADRHGRWDYIESQLLPAYYRLRSTDPLLWRATLMTPVPLRVVEQRVVFQLPNLVRSIAAATRITVV